MYCHFKSSICLFHKFIKYCFEFYTLNYKPYHWCTHIYTCKSINNGKIIYVGMHICFIKLIDSTREVFTQHIPSFMVKQFQVLSCNHQWKLERSLFTLQFRIIEISWVYLLYRFVFLAQVSIYNRRISFRPVKVATTISWDFTNGLVSMHRIGRGREC